MKRIIEFRGQKINSDRWVVGHYCGVVNDGKVALIGDPEENGTTGWHVKPETIGERTPFNATDGTPLFEGMKVRATAIGEHSKESCIGIISMSYSGGWCVANPDCPEYVHGLSIPWGGWKSIEILED